MNPFPVLFPGSYDVDPLGKSRTFFSFVHCRENLNLVKGKTYLIMGGSKQIYKDDAQQSYVSFFLPVWECGISYHYGAHITVILPILFHSSHYADKYEHTSAIFKILEHIKTQRTRLFRYQYRIGEQTWLEYWPTDGECLSDQHRPTCVGLEELVNQQLLFGCLA